MMSLLQSVRATRACASSLRSPYRTRRRLRHSAVRCVDDLLATLATSHDAEWLRAINRTKAVAEAMGSCRWANSRLHTILVDRLHEYWDADIAVVQLAALMHAAMQLNAQEPWAGN
jgi:hypothetical protein